MRERTIQAQILHEYGKLPWCRIFRRHVGDVYLPDMRTRIQIGVKGQADLYGFTDLGDHFEIEVKTKTGRRTKEQLAWQRVCAELNVIYILARTVEDVVDEFAARGYRK